MFCMAVWLAGTVILGVIVVQNLYTVDRLLTDSPNGVFRHAVDTMTTAPTVRDLLRYLASELDRLYFQYWNLAQLPLGILTLSLVSKLPNSRHPTWEIASMLGVVLFLMIFVTPEMLSVGRSLDFVASDPMPATLRKLALFHTAYAVFTLINIVLGILVTLWIQKSTPSHEE